MFVCDPERESKPGVNAGVPGVPGVYGKLREP